MPLRLSPADITFEDLDRQDAEANPGFLPEVARVARYYTCELYKEHPGFLLPGEKIIPGSASLRRGLLDRMCRPIGKMPPAPTQKFQGGQCDKLYEISLNLTETRGGYGDGQFRTTTNLVRQTFMGKISGMRLQGSIFLTSAGVTLRGYKTLWVDADVLENGQRVRRSYKFKEFDGASDNAVLDSFTVVSVIPISGSDDCGNPLPDYDRNQPPINQVNNNVTINNDFNIPITVPITIVPTLIAPVGIVVRPTLNVNVGGINVEFGLGGVTFTQPTGLPPGTDLVDDPRELPPAPVYNDNSIDLGNDVDLTPVIKLQNQILKELEECCDRLAPFPEPKTSEYDVQLIHEGTGGVFNLPSRTFTVTVEMIDLPGVPKTIEPTSGERVLFAGWAWFHSQGGLCERMPLDADKKAFKPPERAENKITVSCYAGYTCRIRAWYAKANA